MNKRLRIVGNCELMVSQFENVYINSTDIGRIIFNNLPELEKYKKYFANISIDININENETLQIITEGYSVNSLEGEYANETLRVNSVI